MTYDSGPPPLVRRFCYPYNVTGLPQYSYWNTNKQRGSLKSGFEISRPETSDLKPRTLKRAAFRLNKYKNEKPPHAELLSKWSHKATQTNPDQHLGPKPKTTAL